MSRLAAVLERGKLPIDPALTELFEPEEALRYAVAGGEDYELILVGTREELDEVERAGDVPLTVIGEMVTQGEHRVRLLDESGQEVPAPAAGWDHLRRQG
jgi:thiamine-monophosphate kinase